MLEGVSAVVTGGGSGIGRAISERLALDGASVAVADIDADRAREVVAAIRGRDGRASAITMDVADPESVSRAVYSVHEAIGPVNVLVNNAGVGVAGTALSTDIAALRHILDVNVVGVFLVTRAFLPDMVERGGGAVVNVGSVAGVVGVRNRAAYSASKGAVLAFTRSLHADFHGHGIRVNAVLPGTVETPWVERITQHEPDPARARAEMAARQPIGRMGTAQEIAEAVYFLVKPENSFMYGSWLVVDGGLTAV